MKNHLETNENRNTNIQNLWDAAKGVMWSKFTAIQAYFKKQEKSEINSLNLSLKKLEKEGQTKPKVTRRKEIIKIRAKINEIEKRKIEKIIETKSWISERVYKLQASSKTHQAKETINKISKRLQLIHKIKGPLKNTLNKYNICQQTGQPRIYKFL